MKPPESWHTCFPNQGITALTPTSCICDWKPWTFPQSWKIDFILDLRRYHLPKNWSKSVIISDFEEENVPWRQSWEVSKSISFMFEGRVSGFKFYNEHEKMPDITNHWGHANQTTMSYHPTPVRMAVIKRITNPCEEVENREPWRIVGGNVNLCRHYGKQYGSLSDN